MNKDIDKIEGVRRNFFTQRVVNKWYALPSYVVAADSVNLFKNRYDRMSYYK